MVPTTAQATSVVPLARDYVRVFEYYPHPTQRKIKKIENWNAKSKTSNVVFDAVSFESSSTLFATKTVWKTHELLLCVGMTCVEISIKLICMFFSIDAPCIFQQHLFDPQAYNNPPSHLQELCPLTVVFDRLEHFPAFPGQIHAGDQHMFQVRIPFRAYFRFDLYIYESLVAGKNETDYHT